jgi:hypothetical protein
MSEEHEEQPRERPAPASRVVDSWEIDAERARGHAGRRQTVPGVFALPEPDEAEEPAEGSAKKKK